MIVKYGAVQCSLVNFPESVIEKLRSRFFYFREQNRFGNQENTWSNSGVDRFYLVSATGRFKTGLFMAVVAQLEKMGLDYEIEGFEFDLNPTVEEVHERLGHMPFKLRDYQLEAVLSCTQATHPYGMIKIPTGGGKTVVMAGVMASWEEPSVILVNSKDLFHQLHAEMPEYTGIEPSEFGRVGDSVFDIRTHNICMVPTLSNIRKGTKRHKEISKMYRDTRVLFIDEAHHVQAKTYQRSIQKFKSICARYGFTASPITSEYKDVRGKTRNYNILLEAYCGPSVFTTTIPKLIDEGWLARPSVMIVENFLEGIEEGLAYTDEYQRTIVTYEPRNKLIAGIASKAYWEDKQVIIFVERINHGHVLSKILTEEFGVSEDDVAYVSGETLGNLRSESIESFKAGDLPILIGTVLSEGLNFFCDVGIEASAGKSEKKCIQRPGRVLRKERDPETGDVNRNVEASVDYYDFRDRHHPIFVRQSGIRNKLYKKLGFEPKLVKVQDLLGEDFD